MLVDTVTPDGASFTALNYLSVIYTAKSDVVLVEVGFLIPLTVILKVYRMLI